MPIIIQIIILINFYVNGNYKKDYLNLSLKILKEIEKYFLFKICPSFYMEKQKIKC